MVSIGQDIDFIVYLECSQKISVEVATHRPPILFSLVDGILVDCCLSFTHSWIGMALSYKEMSLEQQKRALGLLLSQSKDGVLPWGSLTIVTDEIGVAHSTISRLWWQAEWRGLLPQVLDVTPTANAWLNPMMEDDSDQDSDDSDDDAHVPMTTATPMVEMDGEGGENATDAIMNTGV